MAAAPARRIGRDVAVGDRLHELPVRITATTIVLGASATRDWQPQHHDHAWAVHRAGTRDIFMNTPTQAGWISRYITDWTGPTGRIGRMAFRMRASIYPDDTMVMNATVTAVSADDAGTTWVDLEITLTVGDTVCTTCTALVALPSTEADNPWTRTGDRWVLPAAPEPVARDSATRR